MKIEFADPYKKCNICGGWVTGVRQAPGPIVVLPCEHDAGYRDVCPSWGPVDGCTCAAIFGQAEHGTPPPEIVGERTP